MGRQQRTNAYVRVFNVFRIHDRSVSTVENSTRLGNTAATMVDMIYKYYGDDDQIM
jgi:hypothetical protein